MSRSDRWRWMALSRRRPAESGDDVVPAAGNDGLAEHPPALSSGFLEAFRDGAYLGVVLTLAVVGNGAKSGAAAQLMLW